MLRVSTPGDLAQIKALSTLIFGDEPEQVDLFHVAHYRPEYCYVAEEKGTLTAMAFALPMTAVVGKKRIPAAYIYSVGTHPDWRHRGLSTCLLDFIWQELLRRGVSVALLVPAEQSLFDFYARRGYHTCCRVWEGPLPTHFQLPPLTMAPVSPADYLALREGQLGASRHFRWEVGDLAFQQQTSQMGGGDIFRLGSCGCAVVDVRDSRPVVRELLVPREQLPQALAAVRARWPRVRGLVRLGEDLAQGLDFAPREFAMVRCRSQSLAKRLAGAYFSLAMD